MAKAWKTLLLNNSKYQVKVDAGDYPRIIKHSWRVVASEGGKNKIIAQIKSKSGNYITTTLGKFIMRPAKNKFVYPRRFFNGLDFRRSNLILCSMQERQIMLPPKKNKGSSKYKGVSIMNLSGQWRASIKINGEFIHIGTYKHEDDAARAYNRFAKDKFGDFAYQNQILKSGNRRR